MDRKGGGRGGDKEQCWKHKKTHVTGTDETTPPSTEWWPSVVPALKREEETNQGNGSRVKVESSRLQCAKPVYELGLDDLAVNLTLMLNKPDNPDTKLQT